MRLARLHRMSPQEWRWRTRELLHTLVERARVGAGAHWSRKDLTEVLSEPARDACAESIAHGRWLDAHRTLEARMLRRPARFVLDPRSAALVRDRVLTHWPDAAAAAAGCADRLLEGYVDLLGYAQLPCAPDGHVDWHADPVHQRTAPRTFYADVPYLNPGIGDHKVIWELNRHQHFLRLGRAAWLTGDERYPRAIVSQIHHWLAENPPYVGINWASMLEIGFRSLSWTWALHCLLGMRRLHAADDEDPWIVDLLVALDRQLRHVERHLSCYFSPNTHLTGEALALYVVGTALPELASSQRWADTGRRILLEEIDRQILEDGGHAEQSTHYQRYTLDFYLLATLTARLAHDTAANRFADAARRTAAFTAAMAGADGRLPLIGDDDGGMLWPIAGRACCDVRDSLALAATVLDAPDLATCGPAEEVVWIAGPAAIPASARPGSTGSCLLPASGYFVARTADGSHAVLDVGPHGYRNGGHAHADALSLVLSVQGRPLLIDPGTSTYTMDSALRDRMRSTAGHNTITIDDRSQSMPAGPFHWASTTDAQVSVCRRNPSFDWIEATHDGYAPVRHRRTVVRTRSAGWLIVDAVEGSGHHAAAAYWHFDPAWHIAAERGGVRARCADGLTAWLLVAGGKTELFHGDHRHGWCAPVYGRLEPAWTARTATEATAPFAIVTWIGSGPEFPSPVAHCRQSGDASDRAIVFEVLDGCRRAVFMVRAIDAAGHTAQAGEFRTDAAMLQYTEENGRLLSLSMAGGTQCLSTRHGWPSVSSDDAIADLHIDMHDKSLALESFEPPATLTIRGAADCAALRVNGRELPLSSKSTTMPLLIHGSDWLPFSAGNTASAAGSPVGAAFARE